MKFKRTLFSLTSLTLLAAPIAATVSCSSSSKKPYDLGLATAPINSLNYLKFKNTGQVAPALVEGLFKPATTNKVIQSQLNFPEYELDMFQGSEVRSTRMVYFLQFKEWGYVPGSTINSSNGVPIGALASKAGDYSNFSQLAFQLNDAHMWSSWKDSNGVVHRDHVQAKDYVDAIKYILDINTGSQYIVDLLEYGIKNAQLIVDLQNEYYTKFHTTYRNPFGYEHFVDHSTGAKYGKWQSQNTGDDELVAKIKTAAQGLGVFTAEQKTKGEAVGVNEITWFGEGVKHQQMVSEDKQLFYQFEKTRPLSYLIAEDWGTRNYFLPIDRDFVEAKGGIAKFGIDKEHFQWNSAFNPETINLGPAGYIDLVKDLDYYAAERTVSNRIKIYFQSDPTVLASMYEDGYISEVKIPAIQQQRFWSNQDFREYMTKKTGHGTIAFQMNLENNGNPALQNENLRKAISFAIDRNSLSYVAGQESSYPVTSWTTFNTAKDLYGNQIETYFDGETYKPMSTAEYATLTDAQKAAIPQELPIQALPTSVHNSKNFQFESVDRTDKVGHNEELAKYFLEKYKQDLRDAGKPVEKVTLKYIYDGTIATKNVGIYLQAQLNKILGGLVDIDIQGLPANVFESYKVTGKFDILYGTFDSYGVQWDSYIKRFFEADGLEGDSKTQGFINNPSGRWTYRQWFKDLKDATTTMDTLNIKQPIWDKMIWLADKATATERDAFFSRQDTDVNFQEESNIVAVVSGFEKILRAAMPIIPLTEVDTYWDASRVGGVYSLSAFNLQTAYDVKNKPMVQLPSALD